MSLPPLHPILVNFTAALVPISLLSDVLGRILRKPSLTAAGWWTLLYAVLFTPLTVLAGWFWLKQMSDMDHSQMGIHKWLGTALAFVLPMLLWFRWRPYRHSVSPAWPYLSCAAFVVAALTLQGHLGGMMSFGADESPAPAGAPARSPMDMHGGATNASADSTLPASSASTSAASTSAPPTTQIQWKDHIDVP